jgi:Protein of unknown function (DUF2637)
MTASNNRDPVCGPGLFRFTPDDPGDDRRWLTDRWSLSNLAGKHRRPGSMLIGWAGWLLAALGAGLLFVSFAGQYKYIFAARQQQVASVIEALMLDAGMIIFSLLALGLARSGKPARTERVLIVACAAASAGMNYAAADDASPRSVIAFTAAPVFLAVVVDRVIAVIRRHVLGDKETSPWTLAGRALRRTAHAAGLAALYSLRFALAARETGRGLRQVVLDAAPLPGIPAATVPALDPPPSGTKKDALLSLYRRHTGYGDRSQASRLAAELGPCVGLQSGTARSYIYAELNRTETSP